MIQRPRGCADGCMVEKRVFGLSPENVPRDVMCGHDYDLKGIRECHPPPLLQDGRAAARVHAAHGAAAAVRGVRLHEQQQAAALRRPSKEAPRLGHHACALARLLETECAKTSLWPSRVSMFCSLRHVRVKCNKGEK